MPDRREVPTSVRVRLAHAAVQRIAEAHGVDLLHVKGPAVAAGLRPWAGGGSDVDVIVRPDDVPALMAALHAHGWRVEATFEEGSAFEHAATLFHPSWGLLDVHRTYPGMDHDPAGAFAVLWEGRGSTDIGHVACPVPDPLAQSLVLLLHAARTPTGGEHPDVAPNWTRRTEAERQAIRELAARTHATVGLAAATGDLASHAGTREAALWEVFSGDGDRLDEWRARWRAARGPRDRAAVLVRALGVNRYHLGRRLGHEPSRAEVAVESARRVGQLARALAVRAGRRGRR